MQHGKVTLHEHVFISVIHLKDLSGSDKRSALRISYEKFLNSLFFCLSSIKVFFCVHLLQNINALFTELIKHLKHND